MQRGPTGVAGGAQCAARGEVCQQRLGVDCGVEWKAGGVGGQAAWASRAM